MMDESEFVRVVPNTVLYEQQEELKDKIFELFSTGHSPTSAATSLKQLLCCLPLVPVPAGLTYENIFRVTIVQFLDPYNFDVRSVKRSCIHIVHPDGRIIPFDTFNMFYRETSAGYHLVSGLGRTSRLEVVSGQLTTGNRQLTIDKGINMSQRREFVQVIWGILILLGLKALAVGICLAIASLGVSVAAIYAFAIGISQLLYVVPLCI